MGCKLRRLLDILSRPQLLDVLNFHVKRYTCSSVTGLNANWLDALLSMYCSREAPVTEIFLASFSPSEQKC